MRAGSCAASSGWRTLARLRDGIPTLGRIRDTFGRLTEALRSSARPPDAE